MNMETVQMSAEERKEYEAFKAAKAEREAKEKAKQDKRTLKEMTSESVESLMEQGRQLSARIKEFKREVYRTLAAAKELKNALYGQASRNKSDTYTNLGNTMRITTGQYELDSFDDTANIAAGKIEEFMATLAKDGEDSQTLYSLLQDFVSRDKNGNLRAANILKLRKKVDENPRLEPIREYVQMIEEAWQPVKSKTYIRLEERTETGAWKAVPLNATEV